MTTATKRDIVISRTYDGPRELLWNAWSDPSLFEQWWGPKAFTAPHIEIDFRVKGKFLYCMRGPGLDGATTDFWNTGEYLEIVPMEKIVSSDGFSDDEGNMVPASYYNMPGDWPLRLMLTVTFEERGNETVMKLRHTGIPEEMAEACEAGWGESLDKLEEVLKKERAGVR